MTNNNARIVDVGQSPETADDSAKLKMQRLKHWVEEQGATFTAVEITEGEHGREIRARVPVKEGALVMHIPKSLLITAERATASAIAALLSSSPARISSYGYLAMYLLELKREGGYWKPYLDMLPTDFTEHPNFFSEPELAYMKGCYSLPVIRSRRTRIDAEYEQIRAHLPTERMVTREEYAWAMCVVQTRAHSVSLDGKTTVALIPLADLPNHDSHWNMSWQLESKLGFIYSASCNIEAGAPLTIGYGVHCNGHWFSTYGFIIGMNPHNLAEIPVPALSPDHPCYAHAKNLGTEREGMRVFQVPVDYDHPSARALFSYLRLGALTEVSCLCADKDGAVAVQVGPVGLENENAALAELAAACRLRLQQFDTSIEEDEALLRDQALPRKLHNAVRVRLDEKLVLNYYLDLATAAMTMRRDTAWPKRFASYSRHVMPLLEAPQIANRG